MGLPDPAPIPRASPGLIPEPDRTPALIIHLSPLLGLVLPALGNVLGPLAAWLAYRDRAPVLDQQGKEALNFQLSVWLYAFLTGLLFLALFSLGLLGGVFGAAAGSPHLGALALFLCGSVWHHARCHFGPQKAPGLKAVRVCFRWPCALRP